MTKVLDFRSDTVTRPTAAMREAMARAEVGDDVYGEDPTVNRLQEMAAERLGKQSALFVPSGTMANQAAIRAQTRHGDLVIASEGAHIVRFESGAAAAISGVQVKTVGRDGMLDPAEVRAAITPADAHHPVTSLVAIENTHNAAGGRIVPLESILEIAAVARDRGLRLHLDGARLFNAVVATGIPAAAWARPFDTVSFCLSKGLGAPVGSLVCGDAETIRRVHRVRKMLGGGMRQAGILAAAGIHALENHVERLARDHALARRLAAGLGALGCRVDPVPETNIVLFAPPDPARFARAAKEARVLVNPFAPGFFRAVTHLDVNEADVDESCARLQRLL